MTSLNWKNLQTEKLRELNNFDLGKVENIVRKGENADIIMMPAFSPVLIIKDNFTRSLRLCEGSGSGKVINITTIYGGSLKDYKAVVFCSILYDYVCIFNNKIHLSLSGPCWQFSSGICSVFGPQPCVNQTMSLSIIISILLF